MKRVALLASAAAFAGLLVLVLGCNASPAGAGGASSHPTSASGSPSSSVGAGGAGGMGGQPADASSDATGDATGDATSDASRETPIGLAEAWVAGWYGTSYRGTSLYAHVDVAGYPNGYYTQWRGDPGVTRFGNVTDCSSFSDVLLTRAYGWVPPTTNPRPLAADYYWAIRSGVRFQAISSAADLQVGDVFALLYGTTDSGGDSGHVAWIDALPTPYQDAPDEPGLTQFAVTVIDSALGFHNAPAANAENQDDRSLGALDGGASCTSDAECVSAYGANAACDTTTLPPNGVCAYTGVGRGPLRIYVDASGNIAGYTWSTSSGSTFYGRPSPLPQQGVAFTGRDIVAGRYVGP